MKLTEIQDLIKFVARAGVTEVEIEQKEFKLTIKSEMPKGRGKKEEQVVQTIQVPAAMPQMVQAAPWPRHLWLHPLRLPPLPRLRRLQRPRLLLKTQATSSRSSHP